MSLLLAALDALERRYETGIAEGAGGNCSAYFSAIREIYRINHVEIMAGRYDPYLIDWTQIFTPIERDAWGCIRCRAVPFFPQYPALSYFLDFGDPVRKIALECDGKAWHDREKDRVRDEALAVAGWRVFRVTGAEAYSCLPSPDELHCEGVSDGELEWRTREWLFDCVDGVVAAIKNVYYRRANELEMDGALQTLDRHRLAQFALVDDDPE